MFGYTLIVLGLSCGEGERVVGSDLRRVYRVNVGLCAWLDFSLPNNIYR